MWLFKIQDYHAVENVTCVSCNSSNLLRINRFKVWLNHFISLLLLFICVLVAAQINWQEHYDTIKLWTIILSLVPAIFIGRKIRFYFVHESREWLVHCKGCRQNQYISPFDTLSDEERKQLVLKMFYGEDKRGE
jgi:hypothetical protein